MVSMMSAACSIPLYLGVAFDCLVEIKLEDAAFESDGHIGEGDHMMNALACGAFWTAFESSHSESKSAGQQVVLTNMIAKLKVKSLDEVFRVINLPSPLHRDYNLS